MADEAVHEIQLNGKQLVFTFMAATVVAVVVFLCGVMVGRGVRAPRTSDLAAVTADPLSDPTTDSLINASPLNAPAAAVPVPNGAPAASQETLSYPTRLEGAEPPDETLRDLDTPAAPVAARAATPPPVAPAAALAPATPTPAPAAAPSAPPPADAAAKAALAAAVKTASDAAAKAASAAAAKAAPPAATPVAPAAPRAPVAVAATEPAGNGFVVQVAATRERGEADTIARRLAGKGYPAFVTSPAAGMFRVRVGKFTDRREAETVATRLEKEEQFKPWVTR